MMSPPCPEGPRRRATQYLRRSTGLQAYSLEHQAVAIAAYARDRGYELVSSYSDSDRSGLTLKGRPALQALLACALGENPGFAAILVYDVSRWGRFQDVDEGAHYEYLCRKAGLVVEYCVEPFDNDGSLESALIKEVKRSMAGEYSRDLSAKLTAAKRRMAAKGFVQCGTSAYGLRRLVVDAGGRPMGQLERGEYKITSLYRTTLAPGPAAETATVTRVFRLYVITGLKPGAIAETLNRDGTSPGEARTWTAQRIARMLRNPAYVGAYVFGRSASHLKQARVKRPRTTWVVVPNAFPPILDPSLFDAAQRLLEAGRRRTNHEMLAELRALLAREKRLSARLIDSAEDMASAKRYAWRFGGLRGVYALIGYDRRGRKTSVGAVDAAAR
jgi:DNA invertase Pin-like site-specific DNA recombinase